MSGLRHSAGSAHIGWLAVEHCALQNTRLPAELAVRVGIIRFGPIGRHESSLAECEAAAPVRYAMRYASTHGNSFRDSGVRAYAVRRTGEGARHVIADAGAASGVLSIHR
jgi:hypothetical protein